MFQSQQFDKIKYNNPLLYKRYNNRYDKGSRGKFETLDQAKQDQELVNYDSFQVRQLPSSLKRKPFKQNINSYSTGLLQNLDSSNLRGISVTDYGSPPKKDKTEPHTPVHEDDDDTVLKNMLSIEVRDLKGRNP